MSAAAFSVTAFLDRRPPPSVASPRSSALTALVAVRRARSASPPSSPSRRALRRRRLGPLASAPLASSAAAIACTRPAPRVFCLPSSTVQARPCSRRDRESAREQGSRGVGPEPHRACLPRGEHPRVDQPAPCPTPRIARVCATHRPRVRQPARPHRPTSPPTTQGPLEAWCSPRPAAAGHLGTVFESRFRRTAARLPSSHGSS